jgi:hypothetical protein
MTHARRGHPCAFCERVVFGNGGEVAHGRSHVRRGEAVELVKHYGGYPPLLSRLFLATDDGLIAEMLAEGFEQVTAI